MSIIRWQAGLTAAWVIMMSWLGGCKEYIAQPVNQIDSRTRPSVVSTYPPTGAVGFYNVYTPGKNSTEPHFYVQFNKLMNIASFPEAIKAIGFPRPTRIFCSGNGYGVSDIIRCYVHDSTTYGSQQYQRGKVYNFVIDTTVEDLHGNHPSESFSFFFTPEPAFRIVSNIPADGAKLVPTWQIVSIRFNSKINRTIFSNISLAPPTPGEWTIAAGSDSLIAVFDQTNLLTTDTTYVVTVGNGAKDYEGYPLQAASSFAFRTEVFKVSWTSPYFNDQYTMLNTPIRIGCTGAIDPASVSEAISIDPPEGFTFSVTGNQVTFSQANDLKPQTEYIVLINTKLRSLDGDTLVRDVGYYFRTVGFNVGYTFPSDNERVRGISNVRVNFTGRIDTASMYAAFVIDPPVQGRFYLWDPAALDFMSDTGFPVGTYHCSIDTTGQSVGGYRLSEPYRFSFTVY